MIPSFVHTQTHAFHTWCQIPTAWDWFASRSTYCIKVLCHEIFLLGKFPSYKDINNEVHVIKVGDHQNLIKEVLCICVRPRRKNRKKKFQFSYYKFHYWNFFKYLWIPRHIMFTHKILIFDISTKDKFVSGWKMAYLKKAYFLAVTSQQKKRQTNISLNFIWLRSVRKFAPEAELLKAKTPLHPSKNGSRFVSTLT